MIERNGAHAAEGRAPERRESSPPDGLRLDAELTGLGLELRRAVALELARVRAMAHQGVAATVKGALGGLVGGVVTVMSTVYLLRGIAGAVAAVSTPWVGQLVVGGGCLLSLGLGLFVWTRRRDARFVAELTEERPERSRVRRPPGADGAHGSDRSARGDRA